MRLFFSLKFSPSQQQLLLPYRQQVLRLCPAARAVDVDNLHLTLFFLGQVDEATKAQLIAAASGIGQSAFSLTLDRLSGFSGPKIVYLAPSEVPDALLQLQQQLAALCKTAGFNDIHDSYQPHITLARQALFDQTLSVSPITLQVNQFALYQSGQFDGRLQYRPLQSFSLL
ncbi:MAG: RNA 2',3'-cyclic phosphodiesterase [Pseudomonadota bacterium]